MIIVFCAIYLWNGKFRQPILPVDSVPPVQVCKTSKNLTSVITNHRFLKRAILS